MVGRQSAHRHLWPHEQHPTSWPCKPPPQRAPSVWARLAPIHSLTLRSSPVLPHSAPRLERTAPELAFLAQHLPTLLPPAVASLFAPSTAPLLDLLFDRYAHHWYPAQPERASGYRAISFEPARADGFVDPLILAAVRKLAPAWTAKHLRRAMRATKDEGWTLWCDPGCVSWRSSAPSAGNELKELWGSLPAHLAHLVRPSIVPSRVASLNLRSHSPSVSDASPLRHRASRVLLSTSSSTETIQGSPAKSVQPSRAIPILAPSTVLRNRGVGAIGVTPPTPIPDRSNDAQDEVEPVQDAASAEDDDEPEEIHMPTTLSFAPSARPASPATPISPTTPLPVSLDDPFVRPSSRSSSGSAGSSSDETTSSSLFSMGSLASSEASVGTVGALFGKDAQKPPSNTWSRHHSTGSLPFAPASAGRSLSPLGGFYDAPPVSHSVPTSPRKPAATAASFYPAARERQHSTASTTSVTSNGSIPRPRSGQGHRHSQSHGSGHGLRVREGPGTVTDYSGGKVGVMGGGVLLGLPKGAPAADEGDDQGPRGRKRGGRRGRGGPSGSVGSGTWSLGHASAGSMSSVGSFSGLA